MAIRKLAKIVVIVVVALVMVAIAYVRCIDWRIVNGDLPSAAAPTEPLSGPLGIVK